MAAGDKELGHVNNLSHVSDEAWYVRLMSVVVTIVPFPTLPMSEGLTVEGT